MSSKSKPLVGGKTLSLWIPDEEWVDDFNRLLAKKSKTDRSITRNSLFLQCVENSLQQAEEPSERDADFIRIYLDSFPPEQAELLRTAAGRQLVVNILKAIISGQFGQHVPPQSSPWTAAAEVSASAEPAMTTARPAPVVQDEPFGDSAPVPVAEASPVGMPEADELPKEAAAPSPAGHKYKEAAVQQQVVPDEPENSAAPPVQKEKKKIPDLFHTLMRNTNMNG